MNRLIYLLENYSSKKNYMRYRRTYDISGSFEFRGINTFLKSSNGYNITIGHRGHIGSDCCLEAYGGNITIGKDCYIGSNFHIFTKCWDTASILSGNGFTERVDRGNVAIGNNVWIGKDVTIVSPITIGNNIVIGCNCVITKDIPNRSLVVGESIIKRRKNF